MSTNSPYPYYHQRPHGSGISISWQYKVLVAVVVGLSALALLVQVIRSCLRSLKAPPLDAASAAGDRTRPQQQQPPPAPVAVEMVSSVGPLVCTYRRADGWREATCGVCLSELADGEAVRVLPACMHYFHAACVHEWLRDRATCPLCRATTSGVDS